MNFFSRLSPKNEKKETGFSIEQDWEIQIECDMKRDSEGLETTAASR